MRSARVEAVGCACECVTGCVCARVLCASACPFIRRYRHVRICSLESSSNNMQCAFHLQHGIEQLDLYIHNLCSECVNKANTMCLDGPHAQQCGRLLQSMANVITYATKCTGPMCQHPLLLPLQRGMRVKSRTLVLSDCDSSSAKIVLIVFSFVRTRSSVSRMPCTPLKMHVCMFGYACAFPAHLLCLSA